MVWLIGIAALGLCSGLLVRVGAAFCTIDDYDEQMPDIEGILR